MRSAVKKTAGAKAPPDVPETRERARRIGGRPSTDVREAERRIYRAMKTLRAVPDHERRFFRISNGWPPYVRDFMDAYDSVGEQKPRFNPTPADVSDYLYALAWTSVLEKNEWRYLWWRSFDLSFRQIAMRIGQSDETARTRYKDAVLKSWSYSIHCSPATTRQR